MRSRLMIHSFDERQPMTAVPEYPDDAIRDRLEGETTVCFGVDSRGRIIRPDVRSSTHEIFDRPAIKAIRASNFEPLLAVRGQSPSALCRIYRFDLDALEVVDGSTEHEVPSAVTTASFAAELTLARAAARRPRNGRGRRGACVGGGQRSAPRRQDGSPLRGGRRDRLQEHDSPRLANRRDGLLHARGRAREASGQQQDGCRSSA